MSLPPNTPFNDVFLAEGTTSVATSPVVAVMIAPCAGFLRKVFAAAGDTTTGTIAVAVAINGGSDVTGGALTIAAGTGARNNPGLDLPKIGTSSVPVSEGDLISFTPSGGTGSTIPGAFVAVIRKT